MGIGTHRSEPQSAAVPVRIGMPEEGHRSRQEKLKTMMVELDDRGGDETRCVCLGGTKTRAGEVEGVERIRRMIMWVVQVAR